MLHFLLSISLSLSLMFCFISSGIFAQTVFEDWVQGRGSQNYFLKSTVKTDSYRNVYQAGATISPSADYDVILTKYDPKGQEIWTKTYDVAGYDDAAIDIYIDASHNVYIAGTTFNPANSGYQVLVLKYSSDGTLLWNETYSYPGSLYNVATSITGDGNQIFIGGITYNLQTSADYLALSYSSNGSLIWDYSWDNVGLDDGITKIYKDGNSIALAGGTKISGDKWIYGIVNIKADYGTYLGEKLSGGTGDGIDRITDIAKDAAGNIYVTGGAANLNTGYDFRTLKLDAYLNIVWSKTYNSSGHLNDVANGLAVDNQGNVYVTGYSETANSGTDYTTLKYNASGTEQWMRTYNGKDNLADTAKAIVLDENQLPVITGVSTIIGNQDFYTIKYDAQGNEVWGIDYNSITNGNDNPFDIAIDADGAIIVAGQSDVGGSYRYTSVKYSEHRITNPPDEEIIPSAGYFTKNSGQLRTTSGSLAGDVKYIGNGDYPKVYVQDNKLSYVFAAIDSTANDTVHRIDMVLDSRNKNPKIRAMDKMDFYQNYYLPTVPDGRRERVPSYKKLVSMDVWSNIDFMLSHNNKGLKYYFICKPGANPADIGWNYNGASSVSVDGSGGLVVASSIGSIAMPKGEAYEVTSTGTRIDKSWQPVFNVSGLDVSLSLGSYNSANTLVIEIDRGETEGGGGGGQFGNMLWNSHWGSASESHFNDVAADYAGSFYICGESEEGDFPNTTGQAVLSNYSNGTDAIVLKMNADIVPQWLTYFGGSEDASGYSGDDVAKAITTRDFIGDAILKDVYICGFTNSVNMLTETNGGQYSVDPSNSCSTNECLDGFIAQFDQYGNLHWSTYFGGDGDETLRDIELDSYGNIYAVGSRNQNTTLTPKNGADNYTAGLGLILEYNPARHLVWANSWDGEIVLGIDIDQNDNIFTTGGTKSSNMPVMHTDPSFPSTASIAFTDNLDAFINKFNSLGQLKFSSYFGGYCYEAGNSIVVDDDDNIYMAGNNNAEFGANFCSDIPLINEITSSPGNQDDFIVKLNLENTNAHIVYSSYIGGNGTDGVFTPYYSKPYEGLRIKLVVSKTGVLFLTTYSRTSYYNGVLGEPLPISQPSGYYVKNNLTFSPGLLGDNYIAAFNQNMDLIWATYHGSDKYDYCGGLALSENNHRLIMVGTGNQGSTPMDVQSFDPKQYDPGSNYDYYQPGPVPQAPFVPIGQGVLFDVSDIEIPLSVSNPKPDNDLFQIFPNPAHDIVQIRSKSKIIKIRIAELSGRIASNYIVNSSIAEIDISNLASGVYIITCTTGTFSYSEKLVKL